MKDSSNQGFALTELLIAVLVVTVLLLGMGQFLVGVIRSGSTNSNRVEVLNAVRSKLEAIKVIPYDQLGIIPVDGTSGAGYFESDPFYAPTYGEDDIPLTDNFELSNGQFVERTVTVTAIDDAADSTGENDWDGVTDPNTESVLDYKTVTVSVTAIDPSTRNEYTVQLSTILVGKLDSELDGAGDDLENTTVGKKQPKNDKKKNKKDSKSGKKEKNKKGRDGKSDQDAD